MSTPITVQTICFLGTDFNEATIIADPGIQSAIANSLGHDMQVEYKQYYSGTGKNWSLQLSVMVSAPVAAAIVAGIGDLVTRMSATQPQITRIVTWGEGRVIN